MFKLLIINPGSTSTKVAVYEDDHKAFEEAIPHTHADLKGYDLISDQFDYRMELILKILEKGGINLSEMDIIIGRGGMMKPISSGIYEVDDAMLFDLRIGVQGQHASNLGGMIARKIADDLGIKAYIVDPVVVDEMEEMARMTGVPELIRLSHFHALNQKAVSRSVANKIGKPYEDCNFVVAHLGGGISVGAHKRGRVVDVNNAMLGDGPFSPERAGTVPTGQLINLCYSGFEKKDIEKKFVGNAGLNAYLGTSDAREVNRRIEAGDAYAKLIYETMAYNIAKEIAAMASVLKGEVDGIIITGGLAYDQRIVSLISERVSFIGEIMVVPGEEEIRALAEMGLMLLHGEVLPKAYI
jgi:butyrate kinase